MEDTGCGKKRIIPSTPRSAVVVPENIAPAAGSYACLISQKVRAASASIRSGDDSLALIDEGARSLSREAEPLDKELVTSRERLNVFEKTISMTAAYGKTKLNYSAALRT